MRAILPIVVVLLVGCQKSKGDLGTQTANIVSDTAVLREAEAAANAVIRNATDCDAVKANLVLANGKLEEAQGRVRTEAGRVTLNALKSQVSNIAQACP